MSIYSFISEYFFRAKDIVEKFNPNNQVLLQFFQRKERAILAGMDEVLELLKVWLKGKNVQIRYLPEGTEIGEKEVVLELEGRYQDFGIYEGLIDGILARSTSIATNAKLCLEASNGKEVICMSDRADHYSNQIRDGRAMYVGGITSFSSLAQAPNASCKIYGSIPHALIQNFKGDVIKVMELYLTLFPNEPLILLADFHNDVIDDSLKVLRVFGEKLFGVRVDTSKNMKDNMFYKKEEEFGVTPVQIKKLREALDNNGGKHVKIFVSSGFDAEKIKYFEDENTPVDAYGVGEALLKVNNTFSADAVKIDGIALAKAGREYQENSKLKVFKWE
ncbi:nicotinate phosphoribosyltransferase [Candidatus Mycoplasma haematobovis]|uniref:nicotinate phosphoribosyltransferase n=1 Tax=Candidatus Mycoplasma haematobovis TaxID=432608 RepID=A0A1A9QCY1_9MOLU|nr:nicotinate phosphoribosyltransferase [Candidatus Mycoplasma haematobovis]OAL10313.1 nicotinate phosphoribosyltransferase [Candidatus Mycoplasma haematobovis]